MLSASGRIEISSGFPIMLLIVLSLSKSILSICFSSLLLRIYDRKLPFSSFFFKMTLSSNFSLYCILLGQLSIWVIKSSWFALLLRNPVYLVNHNVGSVLFFPVMTTCALVVINNSILFSFALEFNILIFPHNFSSCSSEHPHGQLKNNYYCCSYLF